MEDNAIGVLQGTFEGLLANVVSFLPQVIGAILILILGIVIAMVLRLVVIKLINALKVDKLLKRFNVTEAFKKFGVDLHVGKLLGFLVKWFVLILFFIAAADTLGWSQITLFLNDVVAYLPNALIAVVILLVGILLGSFVYDVVSTAVKAAKFGSASLVAGISKWAIVIFAFIAAMQQLGIATALLEILTTGLVAMLALAGGLAFGLGGKEHAKRALDRLYQDISSHE